MEIVILERSLWQRKLTSIISCTLVELKLPDIQILNGLSVKKPWKWVVKQASGTEG